MAKIDTMAANWKAGVQGKGSRYASGVTNPTRNACSAFREAIGVESTAVKKFCERYAQFQANVGAYQAHFESGVQRAIADNSYQKGLTR